MSESDPAALPVPASTPSDELPKRSPVPLMFALASPVRWQIIKLLADGREMNISQGARLTGCSAVNFSKHLSVMLRAGVVVCRVGTDRRNTIFFIPAAHRPAPGIIDYGFCRIDLNQSA